MSDEIPEPTGQHYPDHRERAESRPGLRAPEPTSHVAWEHAENLEQLILECIELWQVARHPRTDAVWPRLKARLRQYRALLIEAFESGELDALDANALSLHLQYVDYYLGSALPRAPKSEEPGTTAMIVPDEPVTGPGRPKG